MAEKLPGTLGTFVKISCFVLFSKKQEDIKIQKYVRTETCARIRICPMLVDPSLFYEMHVHSTVESRSMHIRLCISTCANKSIKIVGWFCKFFRQSI